MSEAPAGPPKTSLMRAMRVHRFGGLDALSLEETPRPAPGPGQVLVRVAAAGVGPWDAWVREGKSALPQPLPLTPGSDLAGVIEDVGPGVSAFQRGEAVFGVTNTQFTGAYAEYALAEAGMIARKPQRLSFVEAASVPVVASTAWQMLFDYGQVTENARVLVLGAAGNVGAYAVQLASRAGAVVIAGASERDAEYVRDLGAAQVIDSRAAGWTAGMDAVDVVIDTIGGDALNQSFAVLKRGGVLVSAVAAPDPARAAQVDVRAVFFLVSVTSERLTEIAALIGAGQLKTQVGETLPLAEARRAHAMLAGAPHKRGKIVLTLEG